MGSYQLGQNEFDERHRQLVHGRGRGTCLAAAAGSLMSEVSKVYFTRSSRLSDFSFGPRLATHLGP